MAQAVAEKRVRVHVDEAVLQNAVREVLVNGRRPGQVSVDLQVPYSVLSRGMKELGPTLFPNAWSNYKPQRGRPRKTT